MLLVAITVLVRFVGQALRLPLLSNGQTSKPVRLRRVSTPGHRLLNALFALATYSPFVRWRPPK
jgi:hypothetical protein